MRCPLSVMLLSASLCFVPEVVAQNKTETIEKKARTEKVEEKDKTEISEDKDKGEDITDESIKVNDEVSQNELMQKGIPENTSGLDPEQELSKIQDEIEVPSDLKLRTELAIENGILPSKEDEKSTSFFDTETGSIDYKGIIIGLKRDAQFHSKKLINFYQRAKSHSALSLRSKSAKNIEDHYGKWNENSKYGSHLIVGIDVDHFGETLGSKTKDSASLRLNEVPIFEEGTNVYTNDFIDRLHEVSIKIGLHELECNNMTYEQIKQNKLSIIQIKVLDIEGAYVQLICTSNKNPDIYQQLKIDDKAKNKQTAWYITHYGLGNDTTLESAIIKRYLPHHSNVYDSSEYVKDQDLDYITGATNSDYYLQQVLEEFFDLELESLEKSAILDTEGKLAAFKAHRAKVYRQYRVLLDDIASNLDILRQNYTISEESLKQIQMSNKEQTEQRKKAFQLSNSLLRYHNAIQNSSLKFLYDPSSHFSEVEEKDAVKSQLELVKDRWSPSSQVYELTQFATEVFFNINELFEKGDDSLESLSKRYIEAANEIIERISLCYDECATEHQPGLQNPEIEGKEKLKLSQEINSIDSYILSVKEEFFQLRDQFIEDSKKSTLRHILPDGTTIFWAYEDVFTHFDLSYYLAGGGGITGLTDDFYSKLYQKIDDYRYDPKHAPVDVITKLNNSYSNQKTNMEIRTLPYQLIMTVQREADSDVIIPLMRIKNVEKDAVWPIEKDIYSLASHIEMGLSHIDVKEVEALIENLENYLGKLEERLKEVESGRVVVYNQERRADEEVSVEEENKVVASNLLKELNLIKDYYKKLLGMNDSNYANFLSEMSFYLNQWPEQNNDEESKEKVSQVNEDKLALAKAMEDYEGLDNTIQAKLLEEVEKVQQSQGDYSIDRDKVISIIYSKEFTDLDRVKWAAFQVYTHNNIDKLDSIQEALSLDVQWFFSQAKKK